MTIKIIDKSVVFTVPEEEEKLESLKDDQKERLLVEVNDIVNSKKKNFINDIRSSYRSFIKSEIVKMFKQKDLLGDISDLAMRSKIFKTNIRVLLEDKLRLLKEISDNKNQYVDEYLNKIIKMELEIFKDEKQEVDEYFKEEWKQIIDKYLQKEIDFRLKRYTTKPLLYQERYTPEYEDKLSLDVIAHEAEKLLKMLGPRRISKVLMIENPEYRQNIIDVIWDIEQVTYALLENFGGTDDICIRAERKNDNRKHEEIKLLYDKDDKE